MNSKPIVSFLKKAIKLEYNDVFLYHKEKQNPGLSDKIRGVFESLGNQEITHLDIFSMELKKIADEPTIELAPPTGAKTLREILLYHKSGEEKTIEFYESFHESLSDGDFKKKLSKVITDEKTHQHILEKLLEELK